jgi:hypothetical protein
MEKLDMVIEEIKKLMLRSAEVVNKHNMNKGELATVPEKKNKKMQQQRHSWRGAGGKLQGRV